MQPSLNPARVLRSSCAEQRCHSRRGSAARPDRCHPARQARPAGRLGKAYCSPESSRSAAAAANTCDASCAWSRCHAHAARAVAAGRNTRAHPGLAWRCRTLAYGSLHQGWLVVLLVQSERINHAPSVASNLQPVAGPSDICSVSESNDRGRMRSLIPLPRTAGRRQVVPGAAVRARPVRRGQQGHYRRRVHEPHRQSAVRRVSQVRDLVRAMRGEYEWVEDGSTSVVCMPLNRESLTLPLKRPRFAQNVHTPAKTAHALRACRTPDADPETLDEPENKTSDRCFGSAQGHGRAGAVREPGAAVLPRRQRGGGRLRRHLPRVVRQGAALGQGAAEERWRRHWCACGAADLVTIHDHMSPGWGHPQMRKASYP